MLIKYQAIEQSLRKKVNAIYVLVGQDHYLLNESARLIRAAWHEDSERQTLHLNHSSDWSSLITEANSYSLFTPYSLIDAHFDKKTFDTAGKNALTAYLKNSNPNCLILIRAPLVPVKQLQWISSYENVTVVQAISFDQTQWRQFISEKLKEKSLLFTPDIPTLIYQYTQGNLLASVQLVEKLALIYDAKTTLTMPMVQEQLIDQCEYQLYELADACLTANSEKAIHLLKLAEQNRTEPTLILWLMTQEIRQLIQLSTLLAQKVPFMAACQQLKIWQQRTSLYMSTLKRFSLTKLHQLLRYCQQIDEMIKSSQNKYTWNYLEQLALLLSSKHH